jgi:hypothetical protein
MLLGDRVCALRHAACPRDVPELRMRACASAYRENRQLIPYHHRFIRWSARWKTSSMPPSRKAQGDFFHKIVGGCAAIRHDTFDLQVSYSRKISVWLAKGPNGA